MREAVVVASSRTALAKSFRGSFNLTRPEDLAAHCIKDVLRKTPKLDVKEIEDVVLGCAQPHGAQGQNIARTSAMLAGLPASVAGTTINRFCSSGLQAITIAAHQIISEGVDAAVGGGVESISMITRDYNPHPGLLEKMPGIYMVMGNTAEVVAKRYKVNRESQDEYSLLSQQRTARAQQEGFFDGEIAPMSVTRGILDKKTGEIVGKEDATANRDECNRPDTTLQGLLNLKPHFDADSGQGYRVSRTQYQYTLEDPDANELNDWTNRFVANLKKLPELEDVATDQQPGGLAVSLVIDRSTASRLGIAPTTIDNTLYDAFGQRQINTMYTQLNQYHVIMEAQPQFQLDPDKLNKLYIQAGSAAGTTGAAASSTGNGSTSAGSNALTGSALYTPSANTLASPANALTSGTSNATSSKGASSAGSTSSALSSAVPLSAFSHFETKTEQLSINHQGQFPAITVSFNLAPNAALGGAITAITKVQKDMHMPASLQADFQGTAASFRNSLSNMPLLILAALVTVYIVLGVLYESFIHPITILSTLPSAGVGAFLALILFHQDLSVVAIIGLVLLIGIVKKNGIMMVDFALDAERNHGKSSTDAIYEACLLRFRPIMMTTMAALLGGLPLAFGSGIGSELRRPLGIAMVGGLLVSQVLTLYTTPVIYIFFDKLAQRFSFSRKSEVSDSGGAEPQPAGSL